MIIVLKDQVFFRINRDLSDFSEKYISRNFSYSYSADEKYITPDSICHGVNPIYFDLKTINGVLSPELGILLFDKLSRKDNLLYHSDYAKVGTFYDFSNSRKEKCPIIFDDIILSSLAIDNYEEKEKEELLWHDWRYSRKVKIKYINISYTICFKHQEEVINIKSKDLIESMQFESFSNFEIYRSKPDIYKTPSNKEYYYGETKSLRDLFSYAAILNNCVKLGLKFDDLDVDKFGYDIRGNKSHKKLNVFYNHDDFVFEIASSTLISIDNKQYIQLSNELISKITPYYSYLIERILSSKIKDGMIEINNELNIDNDTILGYLVYNIALQIKKQKAYYNTLVYVSDRVTNQRFSQIIGYKNVNNQSINKIVGSLLHLEAVDTKRVLYRVGDRDDIEYYDYKLHIVLSNIEEDEDLYIINSVFPGFNKVDNTSNYEYKVESSKSEYSSFRPNYGEDKSLELKKNTILSYLEKICEL